MKSSIEKKSQNYYMKAIEQCSNKQYGKALKNFDKASELNPMNYKIPLQKGILYIDLDDKERALRSYRRSKDLNEQNLNSGFRAGNIHFSNGNYEEAIKWYWRNLRVDPYDRESLNNLGAAQICLGKTEEALVNFKKATEFDDKYIWGYLNQGRAHYVLGNTKESKEMFLKSLSIHLQNNISWFGLSLLQYQISTNLEALTSLCRSCSINKQRFINYQILSSYWSQYKLGDLEQSDKFLKSIIKGLMLDSLNRFTFVQIRKSFINQKLKFLKIVRESLEYQMKKNPLIGKGKGKDQEETEIEKKVETEIDENVEIEIVKENIKKNNGKNSVLSKQFEDEQNVKAKTINVTTNKKEKTQEKEKEKEKEEEEEEEKGKRNEDENKIKKIKEKQEEEFESSLLSIEKNLEDPNTFSLPQNSPRNLWVRLGNFWQWILRLEKARECYYKALEIEESTTVWYFLALCDLTEKKKLPNVILKKLENTQNCDAQIFIYTLLIEHFFDNKEYQSSERYLKLFNKRKDNNQKNNNRIIEIIIKNVSKRLSAYKL
ncbi:cellulose synthase operon protein c [Anaeramoeba flamelloides]|uniref:Cellulose synthase operon protein c n=1 Tax=Anaeramoeba flamelloides TaxID=1746091 RepID=A0ABQ8XEV4_9EUKA|nr:cellulose synthase operon protein c [Anaeramoeba flamelloides]